VALTAAVATAVAAACAAAAVGIPPVLVAVGLVPGIALVAARPERRVRPAWFNGRTLAWVTGGAALVVYVTGPAQSAGGLAILARLAVLAVIPLSLLWPEPSVLRYSLLLSAGAFVAAPTAGWPLAGLATGCRPWRSPRSRPAQCPRPPSAGAGWPGRRASSWRSPA
jgi:hypothetical protein